ncbi:hypothetical protein [Streptomyces werraensis]|uniref:hypothetical protein n=1 Tax=Streptomyces werraensis TaxID=68284 RepID=UPI003830438F
MGADTGPPGAGSGRRGELDVLRALVVVGLVFFHSALVFSPDDDFYVKNATTTDAVTVLAGFGVVWAMPMLFLVAGLGARHSVPAAGVPSGSPGSGCCAWASPWCSARSCCARSPSGCGCAPPIPRTTSRTRPSGGGS